MPVNIGVKMKEEQLTLEKEKIDQIKARLEKKQRVINSKERKIKLKKVLELGDLIIKAGLENMESETLFGALLEIKDQSANPNTVKKWTANGSEWIKLDQQKRLIVSIKTETSENIREILKARKFRWNAFRQEWYGFGHKEELQSALGKENAEIIEVTK